MSRPTMSAILRAQSFDSINAARNGGQGARHRTPATLRLPPDLWDRVKVMSQHFKLAFPDRYVTTTSTVEFLLHVALEELTEEVQKTEVNEYVLCPICQDSYHEDESHECA